MRAGGEISLPVYAQGFPLYAAASLVQQAAMRIASHQREAVRV